MLLVQLESIYDRLVEVEEAATTAKGLGERVELLEYQVCAFIVCMWVRVSGGLAKGLGECVELLEYQVCTFIVCMWVCVWGLAKADYVTRCAFFQTY